MALVTLNIFSESLGMQTSVQVVLPQNSTRGEIGVQTGGDEGKPRCLYLLHGLSDDNTIWGRRTSIERYATEYGLCVVMPSAGRSFYSDEKYGGKYYSYIAKELPQIIEDIFRVSKDSKDRFIGGNSMGGYGAIKIALKEKGRYAAAFGLSSVANVHNQRFTGLMNNIFGGEIPDSEDLRKLIVAHETDEKKPRLYMTIGKEDFMYLDNVEFAKFMEGKLYDYTYVETEGAHNWGVWDQTIQEALVWALK